MNTPGNVEIEVHLDERGAPQTMEREIREGLAADPKRIPSKYFYDERGSLLFEQITRLPEYYLTRAETALLEARAAEIESIARPQEIVELGSGAARKIRTLIEAGLAQGSLRRYLPVEVSEDIVERSAQELGRAYPALEVHAVVGDFERHLGQVPDGGRRLVVVLGSTVGNFPDDAAVVFLRKVAELMNDGDWFLLGMDLVKNREVLEAAYNDSQGVTAEFNRNILNVLNRHMDGDFDPLSFDHVARYNEEHSRIESYLRSRRAQSVRLGRIDVTVDFAEGELLWTEVSCKFTRETATALLERAGLRQEHWLTDAEETFALSLSRKRGQT